MSKQTAVEWLEHEFLKLEPTVGVHHVMYELIEKAKAMEREQIIDAYYQCGRDNFEHIKVINKSATEYYKENYGK